MSTEKAAYEDQEDIRMKEEIMVLKARLSLGFAPVGDLKSLILVKQGRSII